MAAAAAVLRHAHALESSMASLSCAVHTRHRRLPKAQTASFGLLWYRLWLCTIIFSEILVDMIEHVQSVYCKEAGQKPIPPILVSSSHSSNLLLLIARGCTIMQFGTSST